MCSVVTYLYMFLFSGDIGNYYYGQGHPMKPHRIRMTHNLILNYGLYRKMEIYVSKSINILYKFCQLFTYLAVAIFCIQMVVFLGFFLNQT